MWHKSKSFGIDIVCDLSTSKFFAHYIVTAPCIANNFMIKNLSERSKHA